MISLRIRSVFSASWLARNGFLNNLRLIISKVLGLPQWSAGAGLHWVSVVSNRFN